MQDFSGAFGTDTKHGVSHTFSRILPELLLEVARQSAHQTRACARTVAPGGIVRQRDRLRVPETRQRASQKRPGITLPQDRRVGAKEDLREEARAHARHTGAEKLRPQLKIAIVPLAKKARERADQIEPLTVEEVKAEQPASNLPPGFTPRKS